MWRGGAGMASLGRVGATPIPVKGLQRGKSNSWCFFHHETLEGWYHRDEHSLSRRWNQFCSSRNKKRNEDGFWDAKRQEDLVLKASSNQETWAKAKQPFDSCWPQHLPSSPRSPFGPHPVPSVAFNDRWVQGHIWDWSCALKCNWGGTSEFPGSHRG